VERMNDPAEWQMMQLKSELRALVAVATAA
jgi:hypothetical protein